MENTFIKSLIDVTEAMLGAIGLFQEDFNIAENKVKFTISQIDLACLFYVAWPYVAIKVGRPINANPENLFLKGLNSGLKGGGCEEWSDFANTLRQEDDPFKFLEDKFKACDEQAFFNVESSKLSKGKFFIINTIRDTSFCFGQVNARLNVFFQLLLIVNQQKFSVNQRIDSYMRLFLLFYDGNFADEFDENPPLKAFHCIDKSERDYLKNIIKNKSGNEQLRAIGKFIFGEITPSLDETINMVSGRCYQFGKTYYEDIKRSFKSEDNMDGLPAMYTFCGFLYLFDYMEDTPKTISYSGESPVKFYSPGKKNDNFYYWVSKAKYNYSQISAV